jgi:hypothetical protein
MPTRSCLNDDVKSADERGNVMSVKQSNPHHVGAHDGAGPFDDYGAFRYDSSQQELVNFDQFTIGRGQGPEVLAINGFADTSADIELTTAVPSDYASIKISLGNVVNLEAFARTGASGTVTSTAASDGTLTLTKGNLRGTYTASLSIDVKAYIPADKAIIDLKVTDRFNLCISGTGYTGASLVETSAAGGTVDAMTPAGGTTTGGNHGSFDLAKFAASVLNIGQWNIAFATSAPGESLHVLGLSVLTVDATAELPGAHSVRFGETERSSLSFNDASSPSGGCYGPGYCGSSPATLFHTV